jgi:PAT family beta-lactamase induction signal transducer AmpG
MAEASTTTTKRPSTFQSLARSLRSWRTACVVLQSFSSGLPLGLVLVAVPAWLKILKFDNSTIGWVTAAQLPYAFKFLWSPLMDRYAPPFLGRKRGWAVISQAALMVTTLGLAWVAASPDQVGTIWIAVFLIAFASASQDIAVDAYAVEVLRPEEQGLAAGARAASSRFALTLSGRLSITAATWLSWPFLFAAQTVVYPAAAVLMFFSPEPESVPAPPRTLREAVWDPFVAFLRQHRALEITSFLVLYKFGDNLATALVSPFLLEMGYSKMDVGLIFFWIGFGGAIVGTILGGAITSGIGLGHALWLFGFVQAFAHAGYVLIAHVGINRPLMYTTMFFETVVIGMGTGAFSVLLLRLTSKKFSATQYALLSSIFALGRTASGPLAGVMVDALGWPIFFWLTIVAAVPGLVMLHRFVPIGTREPVFKEDAGTIGSPLRPSGVMVRGLLGAAIGTAFAALYAAFLEALRGMRATPPLPFSLGPPLHRLLAPATLGEWTTVASVVLFGVICGLAVAALAAARRGIART